MSKVITLGGEGFIGRNLAGILSMDHDCVSAGLVQSPFSTFRKDEFLEYNPYVAKLHEQYEVYIHLIDHGTQLENFYISESVFVKNVNITTKAHLIIFSSAVIYANPSSSYAKRKIALENFYKEYCRKNNVRLTIVRLFNIFGPYQIPFRQGSLVANLFFNHLCGRVTEINDMSASRDFIFSRDLAKIVNEIIINKICGTFDVASGKMMTIKQIIDVLEKQVILDKILIKDNNVKEELVCPPADLICLSEIPHTDIVLGLQQTYSFYQRNLDVVKKVSI